MESHWELINPCTIYCENMLINLSCYFKLIWTVFVAADDLFINIPLHWRHNDHDGISNHQPHGCLLNRLFRRRSKKTSKLCVTGLCVGNSPGPVNSPHKGPVTRKMFPFDDVIMPSMTTGILFYYIYASEVNTTGYGKWEWIQTKTTTTTK